MREAVRPGRCEGVGWRRRNQHARGGPDLRLWEGRARAERTRNMPCMSVTLDVSKLSGWLNAAAFCRVESRAYDAERDAGRGRGGAWAGGSARAACMGRGPGCEGWGGYRACAERTWNISRMSVTLDVSKLRGWLNAAA